MTDRKTVFMFSGQGSQYFQMGRELFERNAIFRHWMEELDTIVGRLSGVSVLEAIYGQDQPRAKRFERTALTHPAIFMVEFALAQALIQDGVFPDITFGTSMGSFAAAAVAGFIDVNDAIAAVVHHALALEEKCRPGGMIAVLADRKVFDERFLSAHSELAAVNLESHFVVSAGEEAISQIEIDLKQRGLPFQRLPVSFAFHSRWIDDARVSFEAHMQSVELRPGKLPMMCSDRAVLLRRLPATYFWDVARRPMRFRDAAEKLEEEGPHRFIDVGPAGTLATLLKYVLLPTSRSTIHAVLTPQGREWQRYSAVAEMGMQRARTYS